MAFSSQKRSRCKEVEDLGGLSTEQLSSQHFALVRAMSNKDKEMDKIQQEVQDLETKVKECVKALQETEQQRNRLQQRRDFNHERLEQLQSENSELDDRVNDVRSCNEEKLNAVVAQLEAMQANIANSERERCTLESAIGECQVKQTKNEKDLEKVAKKVADKRSTIEEIETKICKIEMKQQKIMQRSIQLSKENFSFDQNLKSSVDVYNELKKQLIALEKRQLEACRSTGQSQAVLSGHRSAADEKERQLQAVKASKFSTIRDLFLLNDSIRSLRSSNKKTSFQIEQNKKDVVRWNDKNVVNTDSLADVLNSRNKCGTCGAEVAVQC